MNQNKTKKKYQKLAVLIQIFIKEETIRKGDTLKKLWRTKYESHEKTYFKHMITNLIKIIMTNTRKLAN